MTMIIKRKPQEDTTVKRRCPVCKSPEHSTEKWYCMG